MTTTVDSALSTVDPSTNHFLSGRFAPVHDGNDIVDLHVVGAVPTDLSGAYLRNGPNPEFAPLGSYTYPLEGDGMIHGVWIEDGTARYCNRFVRTQGLLAEERAGRALFGGIMTPAFVDLALLGDDPDPGWPFKLDAFVNVVRHHDRYLALEEGTLPYEIGSDLATVGRYDFSGIIRWDMRTGGRIQYDTGAAIGEVTFAPRANGIDELDGYLMGYGTDLATDVAGLYIWDAGAFPSPPVAVIEIPARVPNGLHGNWIPDVP